MFTKNRRIVKSIKKSFEKLCYLSQGLLWSCNNQDILLLWKDEHIDQLNRIESLKTEPHIYVFRLIFNKIKKAFQWRKDDFQIVLEELDIWYQQ